MCAWGVVVRSVAPHKALCDSIPPVATLEHALPSGALQGALASSLDWHAACPLRGASSCAQRSGLGEWIESTRSTLPLTFADDGVISQRAAGCTDGRHG